MPKIVSGGGYNSNKLVQSKSAKAEPVSHKGNVAGVAQQGLATTFRKSPLEQGKGYEPGPQKPTGIAGGTYNSAATGPGAQRTAYRSGSQGSTPTAQPMSPTRDTLAEYGPEARGKR